VTSLDKQNREREREAAKNDNSAWEIKQLFSFSLDTILDGRETQNGVLRYVVFQLFFIKPVLSSSLTIFS